MNEIITYQQSGLPDIPEGPEDLSKFIIVAQEKLKAVKAEIRAIQRLDLAEAVYQQKRDEMDRLREAMLLAYQRMGEFTRAAPTAQGKRTDKKLLPSGGEKFEKTKEQTIKEFGLSTSQVQRMEAMARNPDIVEQVIADSQAGKAPATQAEVLRRIKERDEKIVDMGALRQAKYHDDIRQIEFVGKSLQVLRKTFSFTALVAVTDEIINAIVDSDTDVQEIANDIDLYVYDLSVIKNKLIGRRANRGKTHLY